VFICIIGYLGAYLEGNCSLEGGKKRKQGVVYCFAFSEHTWYFGDNLHLFFQQKERSKINKIYEAGYFMLADEGR
jgi:hypothetical protein